MTSLPPARQSIHQYFSRMYISLVFFKGIFVTKCPIETFAVLDCTNKVRLIIHLISLIVNTIVRLKRVY